MKYKALIHAIIFGLFICTFTFSQNESLIDRDPNAKSDPIPSDDLFDLIFEYPCAVGGGEAGIETDGEFIYTTKWNGNQFYKYDIAGTFLDSLEIPGVSNIRDLAWDGTSFFGGAASTTVFELDLENAQLISSFIAPTLVRAIAYNEDEDVFYANNWESDITKFDLSGANLGSFQCGPVGDSYYGFAYTSASYTINPFLWGYAQVGATQNEIVQIELPSGNETGVYFDVGSIVPVSVNGIAGGLCFSPVCYDLALVGIAQNEFIWAIELNSMGCCMDNDLGVNSIIEPASGVGYTTNEPVTIRIENYGWNPQTDFIVSFSHNGSNPYYDTVFATINFNETYDYTFDTTVDLSMGGTHVIESCTHLLNEECVINDCKTKVISGPLNCTLEGYVTNCLNGYPFEGASISCDTWTTLTGADGYYSISDIPAGTYEINCVYPGFCPFDTTITFTQGSGVTLDIALCPAQFNIYPDTVNLSAFPGSTEYFSFSLSNPGDCEVDYTFEGDVSWLNQGVVTSGTLAAGESLDVEFPIFNISLAPGLYEGHIIFDSWTITSPDTLTVILEVLGFSPPINLSGYYDCTDICLTWELPPGSTPLYFNIYREGTLIGTLISGIFCEYNVMPEVEYCYQVSAVYENGESEPTPEYCITVPVPEDLEPLNPSCLSYENGNMIFWDEPDACIEPDGYNLYRNDTLIETFPATTFGHFDPTTFPGIYEYTVSAIYYFGESDAVLADCVTGIDEKNKDRIEIYPNPVQSWLVIRTDRPQKFIEIFNNLGIKVQKMELTGTESIMNLSEYTPGIYHLKITTQESNIYYRKIIVE